MTSFTEDVFADGVAGGTPITAAKLNNIENELVAIDPLARGAAPSQLPSYITPPLQNRYDPVRCLYNWKGSNTRHLRTALGAAAAGSGRADLVFLGDSLLIGFPGSGTTTTDSFSVPRQVGTALNTILGSSFAGTGVVPSVQAPGTVGDRWSAITGLWDNTTYPGISWGSTGATLTYGSQQSGTAVSIFYTDASNQFSYSIDGATAVTVTPGGTSTVKVVTVTGLSNATHTVKLTVVGSTLFLLGVQVGGATSGVGIHNLALGGTTTLIGGASCGWLDGANGYYAFGTARRQLLTLAGITPACVFVSLGTNDISKGALAASVAYNLTTIRGWYPNADFVLLNGWDVASDAHAASFNAYLQAKYALCDALDVPMFDWQARLGPQSVAAANGALGTDATHPLSGQQMAFGKAIAQVLAA
jgi:lysophospholipase L1-like esterase